MTRAAGLTMVLVLTGVLGSSQSAPSESPDDLIRGFRDPPMSARPSTYWLVLNGYVSTDYVEHELQQLHDMGIGGLCIFDMGARGAASAQPPAGPAFMSEGSVQALGHAIRVATRLNMEVQLSVSSSWDMGGSWVEPRHGSMALYHSQLAVEGPTALDRLLPFPAFPATTPKGSDGLPLHFKDVAVLAIPASRRMPGHEFIFKLDPPGQQTIDQVVLYNTPSGNRKDAGEPDLFSKDFEVAVSTAPPEADEFRQVLRASLQPNTEAQRFRFPPVAARYVRLRILSGHDPHSDRVQLGEFEVYSRQGINVVASHEADRQRDGAELVYFSSALGHDRSWTADNIHDGVTAGPSGSWSSAGPPPLVIPDPDSIVDLTGQLSAAGRLAWEVPPGKWVLMRFVCTNTGERLKVPSPNSDGLATDHFNAEATEHFLRYLIERLHRELGDFGDTALKRLYLASYEVRGPIWTPDFTDQFRQRRGYAMTPYLPALAGAVVGNPQITSRFRFDFRKTLGDLLVDAYYRKASETAHEVGLGIESEAGGPGPPIHQVPVDALKALGSVDAMRGEFWPKRPDADDMWVVKETACAAHIYGRRRVHMEAFTSMHHWQDGPGDLKPAADRAFCEGANHFVWHTSSHLPPEAGKPGWVYHAGTHLNANLVWWPKAKPFLDYLSRCSFMLQQGHFVADVCYYYGDQGFNFVPPKHIDPSLGFGYDYDVVNAEVLLNRMTVRDGRFILPDGMHYALLVLPDRDDINLEVLQKIEQLVRDGGTVVGRKPTRSSGLAGYPHRDQLVQSLSDRLWGPGPIDRDSDRRMGEGRIVSGVALKELLQQRGLDPDFSYDHQPSDLALDFIHRRTPDADIYFVRNKGRHWEQVDATFRVVDKAPELWLPDTGEVVRQSVYESVEGGTRLPLRLAPFGSVFVVFRAPTEDVRIVHVDRTGHGDTGKEKPDASFPSFAVSTSGHNEIQVTAYENGTYEFEASDGRRERLRVEPLPTAREMVGPWHVEFPPDQGVPSNAVLNQLTSWTDHPNDGIKYFSGIATYHHDFDVPASWLGPDRKLILDLGRVGKVAEVFVNGQSAGVVWKAPFRVDITHAAREGVNKLNVEVANTWSNRLVGDAQPGSRTRYGRTNIQQSGGVPWAKVRLIESGLLGPVMLVPATVQKLELAPGSR